jgi:phosphatidylinositol alpha-1,6-mannosyltransferase
VPGHLLVTNDFPPKTGGIQVYLHELWRRLETGRAHVLTARSHPDAADFDRSSGVPTDRVPGGLLYFPTSDAKVAIEAAIRRYDPDLVLFDPVWPLGELGPHLSRPYGVVVHGAEIVVPGRLPVVDARLRLVLRQARVVVAAGRYPAAAVHRLVGPGGPTVLEVPPGVDTDRFVPLDPEARRDARQRWAIPDDAELVVSVSRLVPRKGMDTLIEAAARLRSSRPRLQVLIGGSGRDSRRLAALSTARRAPVRLVGRVPDDELPAFLGAADLFVMDCRSRWGGLEEEGFGIVFVEASATGVAAIAGQSGGSDEAVVHGETGLVLSRPSDHVALTAAMDELLSDAPRRHDLGARARHQAVERFDWRVLARQLGTGLAPFDGHGIASRT